MVYSWTIHGYEFQESNILNHELLMNSSWIVHGYELQESRVFPLPKNKTIGIRIYIIWGITCILENNPWSYLREIPVLYIQTKWGL